jgi:hypothetical protein
LTKILEEIELTKDWGVSSEMEGFHPVSFEIIQNFGNEHRIQNDGGSSLG